MATQILNVKSELNVSISVLGSLLYTDSLTKRSSNQVSLNSDLQSSQLQTNGFSPVWRRMWAFRWLDLAYILPQPGNKQGKIFSSSLMWVFGGEFFLKEMVTYVKHVVMASLFVSFIILLSIQIIRQKISWQKKWTALLFDWLIYV